MILRDYEHRATLRVRAGCRRQLDEIAAATVEVQLPKMLATLGEGDFLLGIQSSGAGYGDPLRREPARVARDVGDGLVSFEFALAVYGVVLGADGTVDEPRDRARARGVRAAPRRIAGRRRGDRAAATLEDAIVLHPVCDTRRGGRARRRAPLRCTSATPTSAAYEHDPKRSALLRDLPARPPITPTTAAASPDFVLREYYCPGCATAFAADVAHRDEPIPRRGRAWS